METAAGQVDVNKDVGRIYTKTAATITSTSSAAMTTSALPENDHSNLFI